LEHYSDDLFTGRTAELPPPDPKERFARLQLIRSPRVGLTTFYRLLDQHGSARAAIDAMIQERPDWSPCPREKIHHELKAGKAAGAELILWGDPFYPAPLIEIPDPPVAFWAKGDAAILQRPAIAMVGARNASSIGLRMARRLGAELGSEGIVVVSGLACGTDAAAHDGALKTGTIGVVAGGVDVIYPAENHALQASIAKNGLIISEHPPSTKPTARHFPMRNRIISGLSQGVIVVEAALKSGSMITAKNALDQGRDVLAVPGHPIDTRAAGCNALIRDGATLIRGADDILTALPQLLGQPRSTGGPPPEPIEERPRHRPPRRPLGETAALHSEVLNTLTSAPLLETQLMEDLNVTLPDLDLLLTRLEIDGRIERKTGGVLRLLRQD